MVRLFALIIGVVASCLATPLAAQDRAQTLADIRAELSVLASDIQALRSELVSGGGAAMQAAGGATALDRMNTMEAELVRLTARTEELQNNLRRVIADGTNRIGDLEFRLCELEDGCDVANLPITKTLGDVTGPVANEPVVVIQPGNGTTTAELAVNEQADFDRAKGALDSGDFRGAADQFAAFSQTYTGGPLTAEAHYLRGDALVQLGETSNAARAYLEAFSGTPNGPRAPAALLKLGSALGVLGQQQEACVTLAEVGVRFPTAAEAIEANSAMRAIGCP
ncbi:MAG: tol-pal system protein YbgF [Rhodobacteraceae bacterium]|nr:tol-pal system protein YbgF [Paracoccaceae bacterium]